MTPTLHKFQITPDSFETGTLLRCADIKNYAYWMTSRWSIRRTYKYDYITMKHVATDNGTTYLVESVFRVPAGLTDNLPDSELDNLVVFVRSEYKPFTDWCNDAVLAYYEDSGEYLPLRLYTPPPPAV